MSPRLFFIAAACLVLPACDKARQLADKAKAAASEKLAAAAEEETSAEPDPALEALVDRTEEGAVFRKDVPFPDQLEVRLTRKSTFDGVRVFQQSMLGNEAVTLDAIQTATTRFERIGDHVRLTLEEISMKAPEPEGEAAADPKAKKPAAKKPAAPAASDSSELTGLVAVFRRADGGAWKPDHNRDFKAAAWIDALTPGFGNLLTAAGAVPRDYWFGKRRLKPGDEVPLSGPALGILFDGQSSGELTLVLDSFDHDPNGHPCGVFSVAGNVSRRGVVGPDGRRHDEDISIESGKVWLSLVYPLVLREELETIQTAVSGSSGGPTSRIQGAVRVETSRDWQPADAG